MTLPVYTELSNFDIRAGGKKGVTDITVVLIINGSSDPVDSINSIYQFVSKTKYRSEFILINLDREGYKYDKLLATFPAMRVMFPREHMSLKEAVYLGVHESLSRNILFMDENCAIRTMNLEVMEMYLSETSFGMFLPLLVDEKDAVIPNIIKGSFNKGFIRTNATDIVGTAVPSIYPKYFCFLLNRDAFISRDIELSDYESGQYTLLELGYRLWKEGYIITQARMFKVFYSGKVLPDITEGLFTRDYLQFNFTNFTGKEVVKGRKRKMLWIIIAAFFTLKWRNIGVLVNVLKNYKKTSKIIESKPVEDFTIFSIINRDGN